MKIELSVEERLMLVMILNIAKKGNISQLKCRPSLLKRMEFNIAERTKLGMDLEEDSSALESYAEADKALGGEVPFEFNRVERGFLGKYLWASIEQMAKVESCTEVHLALGKKFIKDYDALETKLETAEVNRADAEEEPKTERPLVVEV